jgi:S1-C subfamily serine protease
VHPGSAAEKAGLKGAMISRDGSIVPGDVITAVDGKPVDSVGRLFVRLDDYSVGDMVKVTVLREERNLEIVVTLQPGN